MTEKKKDFEKWILEFGFRKNDYNEKWELGENPQHKLNEVINRYKSRDPKM